MANPAPAIEIKICGLSDGEAIDAAVDAGASHVGFIFFQKSPRNVSPTFAAELADPVAGRVCRVAVTVDADDETLDEIVETVRPDMLQLHGGETPERLSTLTDRYGLPLMKALSIRTAADVDRADDYRGTADRLLLDAKPPAGSDLPGGNGLAFDWRLLTGKARDKLDLTQPYMLSGGIDAANVGEALRLTGARAIDVSSGVESAPGRKDAAAIRKLIERVRALQAETV